MQELNLSVIDTPRLPASPSMRDWAATGFRRMRLMAASFILIFGAVVLATWLMPHQYDAQTKILVKHERMDPLVTPGHQDPSAASPPELTEMELNSEVELLKSRDLLEKVVVANKLHLRTNRSWWQSITDRWTTPNEPKSDSDNGRVRRAVRDLENNLTVEPVKRTQLVRIAYRTTDPQSSAAVLQSLVRLYLDKHLQVHRMPGTLDFFNNQAKQSQDGLEDAQKKLAVFDEKRGVIAAPLEKEITLRKLNDFESELRQTRSSVAETEQRIQALEEQQAKTPERLTTEVKTAGNPVLIQQMRSKLLDLELKRTELLQKFTPEYRPVQEIEAEIAQAQEALTNAMSNPIREETTNRDATHEWIRAELAKARAELVALHARMAATGRSVEIYRAEARDLGKAELDQQDLLRVAKTAEENFLLYSRKQEEARISDELDKRKFLNVSVAEEATPPVFPSSPNWPLNLFLGGLLACFASIGLALTADYVDRSFRTPAEVELVLDVPVLAYLPKH